jgi:DNA-binding transcriptional MocR family regulator
MRVATGGPSGAPSTRCATTAAAVTRAGEPDAAHLRLSYGAASPETLREGVARLDAALREAG